MDWSLILVAVGLITFVGGVTAAVANRSVASDRIDHLTGMVDAFREDLARERESCDRQMRELHVELTTQNEKIAHQRGQLDAATGELGQKIGKAIAQEVIGRIVRDLDEINWGNGGNDGGGGNGGR